MFLSRREMEEVWTLLQLKIFKNTYSKNFDILNYVWNFASILNTIKITYGNQWYVYVTKKDVKNVVKLNEGILMSQNNLTFHALVYRIDSLKNMTVIWYLNFDLV